MSDQEEASSTGVEAYRRRLRVTNNVDYSYKKRKVRYVNPFATVIKEKKPKVHHVRTTKNVNHSSSKRKMSYINPFAVESKRKKVEAYQSRSRNNEVGLRNERRKRAEDAVAVVFKKEEDLTYNFRSRKIVNYSLTKRRPNFAEPSLKQLKKEKTPHSPSIKSESSGDNKKCSSKNEDEVERKPPISIITDSTCSQDDSISVNTVDPYSTPSVMFETERAQNEIIEVEDHSQSLESHELNEMSLIKIKTESFEDYKRAVLMPLVNQGASDIHYSVGKSNGGESDLDVQFIPKPVPIVIIDDDDDDHEEAKSETNTEEPSFHSAVIDLDSNVKSETKITYEMSQGVYESDDSVSHAKSEQCEQQNEMDKSAQTDDLVCVVQSKSENIDWILEIPNMTDSLESLFRDKNTLEEPNFNVLNNNFIRRYVWDLENKYRQYEVYSYEGVDNEVGGIENLTEEQLEHPYYKNYHPEPELSEYEKEQIELEKDRICEEASGFNNHLWRRPLNGGPYAQTDTTPIPKCPEFIHAFTPAGQHIAMKTDADRPPKFRTDWDRRLWDFATIFNFNRYREDIEGAHYLPANADEQLEESILKLKGTVNSYFKNGKALLPFEKMLLLNELKLLYWDKCIKTCLPELEKLALTLLDEILKAPVYVFTLIKHVFIFVTIKKVMLQKRYPALRSKATLLYEKIKSNAILKEGETLEEYIFPRAKLIHQHYQAASVIDLMRLNARTATKSIMKKINDRLEGKEDEEENLDQVNNEQVREQDISQVRVEGDNAIETDDDDDDNDSDDSDDDSDSDDGVYDSDEDYDDDDDDEESGTYDEVNDDDDDDEESGTYDEVDDDSETDHDFSMGEESRVNSSASTSSSEDEALMDGIVREE